jgi:diguanylate cyclase (GGDEF)-like protein
MPYIHNNKWLHINSKLDFAYQPIINTHTGATYGLEASLNGFKKLGFESIEQLTAMIYKDETTEYIAKELRQKALFYFKRLNPYNNLKLFYNLDSELFENYTYGMQYTLDIIQKLELKPKNLVIKLNDKENILSLVQLNDIIEYYHSLGIKVALSNISKDICPQMLVENKPDYIIVNKSMLLLAKDSKEFFNYLKDITLFAKNHGILVHLIGIQDDSDYFYAKDLRANLVQGYYFQKPVENLSKIKKQFMKVNNLNRIYRKEYQSIDNELVYDSVEYIEPIVLHKYTSIVDIMDYFKKHPKRTFIPIVDKYSKPLGIIREENLKTYVYSTYGLNILANDIDKNRVEKYVDECSIADIHTYVDDLLNLFVVNENMEGLMVTEEEQYVGFLSARSLLKIIFQKKLNEEADKNPLTKLPGNKKIELFLKKNLEKSKEHIMLIYFDFDYFKPFNDKYGFSKGDEAILIFAKLLQKRYSKKSDFIAHIGGDDFFVGIKLTDFDEQYHYLQDIIREFESITQKFYTKDEIQQRYYLSKDREGYKRKFNLLSVSAVAVEVCKKSRPIVASEVSSIIATAKKSAKISIDKLIPLTII